MDQTNYNQFIEQIQEILITPWFILMEDALHLESVGF